MTTNLQALLNTLPQTGRLQWIGVRPVKYEAMCSVAEVTADSATGLQGDRYSKSAGKRQVTLLQAEHLPVLTSLLGKSVTAAMLRRNLVVAGINLLALKDRHFCIGTAELRFTGLCHPCSRMERILGRGGYNAMRGHGGICAQIVRTGIMRVDDAVAIVPDT